MCLQYLDHFSASIILFFRSKSSDDFADKKRQKQKSRVESVCNYFFFSISEFSYKPIRLLLSSSVVKSDNEMSKFSYKDMECPTWTQPMPLMGRNSSIMWVCSYLLINIVLFLRLEIISFLSIATEKEIGKPECI